MKLFILMAETWYFINVTLYQDIGQIIIYYIPMSQFLSVDTNYIVKTVHKIRCVKYNCL